MQATYMNDFGDQIGLTVDLSIDAMNAFIRFELDGAAEAITETEKYPLGSLDCSTLRFFGLIA